MINLQDYFTRIGYAGTTAVSRETLFAIHRAHAFSIPFENLAIFDTTSEPGYPIRIDERSVVNKLIYQHRGGYCYETNKLLAAVLEQLGFKVISLAARVQQMVSHRIALVLLDNEQYLIDVGFGGNGLIEPLPLILNAEVKQFAESFQLIKPEDDYILQVAIKGGWSNLYSFRLNPYFEVDYEPLNYFIARFHPVFTKNRLCILPTPEGRIILNNNELKIRQYGQNKLQNLLDVEYLATLKHYFGINLPVTTRFKSTTKCSD